ncbi:MAG: PQQ-like beta-propeller repeat protein [Candidatus Nealsonbacteria bacterium]|nr:PQQ-like beta-propeller repeat protein [Candidatus Nealsonbacteria bacterium]
MKARSLAYTLLVALLAGCSDAPKGPSGGSVADKGLSLKDNQPKPDESAAENGGGETTANDWPNWLGPNADGISRETDWTAKWPADGPTTLWKKKVGIGFSSMAVATGADGTARVYTMGHRDGKEFVWCLDAETGDEIWSHSYAGKLVKNLHEGGPCATPTVDGDRVYTVGREGQLYCLDAADGKPVWSMDLQEEFGAELPAWGFTCSPVISGDVLIIEAGRTAALNKTTGKVIWQTALYPPGYGSPSLFIADGELRVAVLNNFGPMIVRADNGKEIVKDRWETAYKTNSTTPIVADGKVFISTGYDKGCALFDMADDKLDVVYTNKKMRNHFNNCVLLDGHLYGVDGNSNQSRNCKVVCTEFATGKVKWEHRGLGCGSLLIADGKLIILSDDGKLVTAAATPDAFRQIGSAQVLTGKCWTVPVLSHGRIYCRNTPGDLVCVDVRE